MRIDDPSVPEHHSDEEERDYLQRRADYHRHGAQHSATTDARLIHLQLVQLYEARIAGLAIVNPDQTDLQKD